MHGSDDLIVAAALGRQAGLDLPADVVAMLAAMMPVARAQFQVLHASAEAMAEQSAGYGLDPAAAQ